MCASYHLNGKSLGQWSRSTVHYATLKQTKRREDVCDLLRISQWATVKSRASEAGAVKVSSCFIAYEFTFSFQRKSELFLRSRVTSPCFKTMLSRVVLGRPLWLSCPVKLTWDLLYMAQCPLSYCWSKIKFSHLSRELTSPLLQKKKKAGGKLMARNTSPTFPQTPD